MKARAGASRITSRADRLCSSSTVGIGDRTATGSWPRTQEPWDRFVNEGVSLAGISVDPIENNRAMVEKLLLPFPLLSDPDGRVIKEWDVWNDNDGGIAKPSIFAIRSDGSIGWAYVGRDFADRPTDDELFNSLRGGD